MVTYNIDVTVTDPILQDVSVVVAEASAGVLLGGLNRYVLTTNSNADNDASWKTPGGFTFVQDTTPTPTRFGETFFDNSTGSTGGYAYVAVDNGSGGLIWIQFAPTSGSSISAPRGVVAYSQRTSPIAGIPGTQTNLTDLSVTFTALAGRRYKVLHQALWYSDVINNGVNINLYNVTAGVVLQESTTQWLLTSGSGRDMSVSLIWSGTLTPGTVMLQMRAIRTVGSGSVNLTAAATVPAFILVEDIGAA